VVHHGRPRFFEFIAGWFNRCARDAALAFFGRAEVERRTRLLPSQPNRFLGRTGSTPKVQRTKLRVPTTTKDSTDGAQMDAQKFSPFPRRLLSRASLAVWPISLLLAVLAIGTVWTTGGTGEFKVTIGYYDMLADAFLKGHAHLSIDPPPALLALADPYDPSQNAPLRLHDASLYAGHYYLYWGPAPAIAHVLWMLLWKQPLPEGIVETVSAGAIALAAWLIIERLRLRYLRRAPRWVGGCAAAALVLGGVYPYLLARPIIYHEPLMVAGGALVVSWLLFLLGVETTGRERVIWWSFSGLMLAISIASRITFLGYAVGLVAVAVIFVVRSSNGRRLLAFAEVLAAFVPLAITGALLAAYNFVRFGSFVEFGVKYALQGGQGYYELSKYPGVADQYFNPGIAVLNLEMYIASIPQFQLRWPYVSSGLLIPSIVQIWPYVAWSQVSIPAFNGIPLESLELPVVSLPILAPVALLFPLSIWWALKRGISSAPSLLMIAILSGGITTFALLVAFRGVSLRYSSDFSLAFVLAGSVGLLMLADAVWRRRRIARALFILAAAGALGVSILCGSALGVGEWVYNYPAEAQGAATSIGSLLAQAQASIAPWSVSNDINQTLADSWENKSHLYLKDGSFLIRAERDSPILAIGVDLEQPNGADVGVTVDGRTVMRQRLEEGFNVLLSAPLTTSRAGEVARVQLQIDGLQSTLSGSAQPLRIVGAEFLSSADEYVEFAHKSFRADDPEMAIIPLISDDSGQTVVAARGISGSWITSAGVDLVVPDSPLLDRCLQLSGPSSRGVLGPRNPDVTAWLKDTPEGPEYIPAVMQWAGDKYDLRVQLPAAHNPNQLLSVIRLKFSSYFVPKELGINSDSRELVIMAPTGGQILHGSCPGEQSSGYSGGIGTP
jgi:hypothetical protein